MKPDISTNAHNPTVARLAEIHALQDQLTSSPWSHDEIELVMAAATSIPISNQDNSAMVWLMVVGAPSSDKTATVTTMRGSKVLYVDSLTENALASAYVPEKGQKKKPDLLTSMELTGAECMVIKDLTTLFSGREDRVKATLGQLQSIYDGEYTKWSGTEGGLAYKPRFAIVGCITPAALTKHHRYMSEIGSRFLFYRVLALTEEEQEDGMARFWPGTAGDRRVLQDKLRELVTTHVEALLEAPPEPVAISPEQQDTLQRLARLLARGRGVIKWQRTPFGDWEIDLVQVEEPFRALQQLRNLVRALARVHGRSHVTDHDLELARRVVLSSMPADRAGVLALFPSHSGGLTVETCAEGIGKGKGRARQLLEELGRLGLMVSEGGSSTGGAPPAVYHPVPRFADVITKPVEPLHHLGDLGGDFLHKTPPTLTRKRKTCLQGHSLGGEFYEQSGWGLSDLVYMPWPAKHRVRSGPVSRP